MKKDDLYFDEPLLRRIKRAAEAEREQAEPSSDRDEEADGADDVNEEDQEDETMNETVKDEEDVSMVDEE